MLFLGMPGHTTSRQPSCGDRSRLSSSHSSLLWAVVRTSKSVMHKDSLGALRWRNISMMAGERVLVRRGNKSDEHADTLCISGTSARARTLSPSAAASRWHECATTSARD